jgi:hypothetical protein
MPCAQWTHTSCAPERARPRAVDSSPRIPSTAVSTYPGDEGDPPVRVLKRLDQRLVPGPPSPPHPTPPRAAARESFMSVYVGCTSLLQKRVHLHCHGTYLDAVTPRLRTHVPNRPRTLPRQPDPKDLSNPSRHSENTCPFARACESRGYMGFRMARTGASARACRLGDRQ